MRHYGLDPDSRRQNPPGKHENYTQRELSMYAVCMVVSQQSGVLMQNKKNHL